MLLPSENKCNTRTEHTNQFEVNNYKLPFVLYDKDLVISLCFAREVSRASCLLQYRLVEVAFLVDKF
jgi:hypothetical protein